VWQGVGSGAGREVREARDGASREVWQGVGVGQVGRWNRQYEA